jgi:hypothetical protein
VVLGYLVEVVAMGEQVALAVGGGMDVVMEQSDVTEGDADVRAQCLVMIAGNENNARIVTRALEDPTFRAVESDISRIIDNVFLPIPLAVRGYAIANLHHPSRSPV